MKKSIYKVLLSSALLVFMVVPASAQMGALYHTTSGVNTIYYYSPHPMKSLDAAKQALKTAFTDKYRRVLIYDWERPGLHPLKIKKAFVFDDRIEFELKSGEKRALYFSKLFGSKKISYSKTMNHDIINTYFTDVNYDKSYYHLLPRNSKGESDTSSIFQTVYISRNKFYSDYCEPYIMALYTIQEQMIWQHRDSLLQAFKPIAAKYRALAIKPPLTEELRKYIVQANFYAEQKNYEEAIRLYKKVIGMDATAYPAAYNNLALLYAQVNRFSLAIFYMRHYLLLEPDGKDARAAQDKIYEWDVKINPPN